MPGSGKSTTSEKLALQLGYQWIDLDQKIEEKAGMRIQALLNTTSEKFFREVENSVFEEWIGENQFVMSCGGGTPCFYNHIEQMNNSGLTIWLNIPLEQIAERIMSEPDKRPLLTTASFEKVLSKLEQLLEQRQEFYSKAQLIFNKESDCLAYFS